MSSMPANPVSQKNQDALKHFSPLHYEQYVGLKERFIEWLFEKGKNPIKGEGYAENTVKQTHYKIEEVYRWVWRQEDGYTSKVTEEHADQFITEQIKQRSDADLLDFIKSIKRLHKFYNNTSAEDYDWEYEHKEEISAESSSNKTIDYFKRKELHALYEAAVDYGSMKSYHNDKMTADERERLKVYLSQCLEKPKSEIGPDEFRQANSWKIPSIISTCIDVGLRPIEVRRAKVQWVNLSDNEIVIPARESTKNDESWQCKISNKTCRTLSNWLDERKQYDKYDEKDTLWLTKVGTPYSTTSLNPLLDNLLELTDIQPHGRQLTWYAIRRGCATMWADKGSLSDAQEQLRHCELDTTLGYTSSPDKKREGIANDLW